MIFRSPYEFSELTGKKLPSLKSEFGLGITGTINMRPHSVIFTELLFRAELTPFKFTFLSQCVALAVKFSSTNHRSC